MAVVAPLERALGEVTKVSGKRSWGGFTGREICGA
jgi:hypothetical protein